MDTSTSNATPTPTPTATLSSLPAPFPSTAPSSTGPVAAGLLLAALAAAALVMARRRRRVPRLVEIVESASLGPRRALVVARMGGELLLLGSSEGGIALLSTRPDTGGQAVAAPLPDALPAGGGRESSGARPELDRRGLLGRLTGRRVAAARSFDAALAESLEDAELRRKLAAGQVGSVR